MLLRGEDYDSVRLKYWADMVTTCLRVRREAHLAGDTLRWLTCHQLILKGRAFAVRTMLKNGMSMVDISKVTPLTYRQVRASRDLARHYWPGAASTSTSKSDTQPEGNDT